ncbi:TetR/AcrR family transcriptional regulator [Mycolicibacterium litorale]|uniref:TetR family transcriptional regulator n=1 Tax=Mycolicibacterium litorale TaxID=758802 RepID=A0AAD1IHQ4_9MYCO|nr:TetR/AcrR family transcriptional regulator [Mycolicibacterium litorale]MCV7414144.1 TetR/AcrR family transcriptional regulator [Mycolicibacterium litorale]TDY02164.1 TetR family transcriptional regulator [Mycolicibacterium litorale]BBY15669.1 TetR family transcriptional regulator [Mycolicibacterium litorale]
MTAGRPRDARVTEAILDAVLAELADRGFGGLTMDAVARRAGVGKSALYRRWPSKVEMTADLMRALSVTEEPAPDTGSFAGDVRALLEDVLAWLTDERVRRVYPDLLAEAQRHPALGEAMTTYVARPRRARATAVLERAAERGELGIGADQEVIVDALGALVFWRLIALSQPVTAQHLDRVTAAVCAIARGADSM